MKPELLTLAASAPLASPVGWRDFEGILPILILVTTGSVVLAADLFRRGWRAPAERGERTVLHFLALLGTVAAGAVACASLVSDSFKGGSFFVDAILVDRFSLAIGTIVIIGTFLSLLASVDALHRLGLEHGEYHGLVLYGAASMILLVQAGNIIVLFLAIETLSISVYVLTAFTRDEKRSVEGAFKYFVLGSFSSGFLLLGLVLVYGATGELGIAEIAARLRSPSAPVDMPLLLGGLGLTVVGLGFKVGAFPFHAWLPDAYEGAPTTVTAFMAVTVKAASFGVLVRMAVLFGSAADPASGTAFVAIVGATAAATMVFGNVVAILQNGLKRMLAYSAIAHTGYLLVGVVAAVGAASATGGPGSGSPSAEPGAGGSVLFYLFSYGLSSAGAFVAIAALAGSGGKEPETFDDCRGLAWRDPVLALSILVLMVSFIGIPPTAGFWGKLYVFRDAIEAGHWKLALLGVLTSIVSAYYYLRLVVVMYMRGDEGEPALPERAEGGSSSAVVALCAAAVVAVGLLPDLFFRLSAAWALR